MKQKTTPVQSGKKSVLTNWFFKQPVKFAALSFGLMVGIGIIYTLLNVLIFGTSAPIHQTPLVITVLAGLVISICMLIKWLPTDNLDRRSFVAIDNGLSVIYMIAMAISTIFIAASVQHIIFYAMWLQAYSMILFVVTAMVASIVYLYLFGIAIAMIYGSYRRARGMGVSRLKSILAVPFGLAFIWLPGYLLSDDKNAKHVITIKSKWYSAFTNWVVAKPINAVIVFAILTGASAGLFDVYTSVISLGMLVIFCAWLVVTGPQKLRKNIAGAFATVAIVLNVLVLIWTVYSRAALPQQTVVQTPNVEMVQVQE